jgi:hypothetical protein
VDATHPRHHLKPAQKQSRSVRAHKPCAPT